MKLSSREVINVIEALVGATEAYGETNVDRIVLENLRTVIDIGDWALDRLKIASQSRHRPEASMREIGETAFSAMDEWRQWIEKTLEDD